MVAACSGGGELTIPAIPEIPVKVSVEGPEQQPTEQPSGGLRELPKQPGGTPPEDGTPQPASGPAKFFPLKANHLTRMALRFDTLHDGSQIPLADHPLDGRTTLDTLVPSTVTSDHETRYGTPPTSVNIPQFSAFNFGEPQTLNGIPVQEATTQADRYAAYAYQAILEHSAHIFQTGMRHNEELFEDSTRHRFKSLPYIATLSTGERATLTDGSSGISGTWTGKAFGIEGAGRFSVTAPEGGGLHSLPSLASTETRLVTADVEITANIRSDALPNSKLNMKFYDWEGSRDKASNGRNSNADDYTELVIGTSLGGDVVAIAPRSDFDAIDKDRGSIDYVRVSGDPRDNSPVPEGKGWHPRDRYAELQFYGPDGKEVAGWWYADWRAPRGGGRDGGYEIYPVRGGFVAKKK